MTTSVTEQTAYVAVVATKLNVAEQTAYVVMTSPVMSVASQTAYIAMFPSATGAARRRQACVVN